LFEISNTAFNVFGEHSMAAFERDFAAVVPFPIADT
jgi:hypothetical protein